MATLALGNSPEVALVDDEDLVKVEGYRWRVSINNRTKRPQSVRADWREGGERRYVLLHRLILPGAGEVDHINGNVLDNRKENLRVATVVQNRANRRKYKVSTSRFKGVSFHVQHQKWYASIGTGTERKFLGLFKEETEAARAYDRAAKERFGEFAHLNFPEGVAPNGPALGSIPVRR